MQAAYEAEAQLQAMGQEKLAAVFFASGSTGTYTGLAVGARMLGWTMPLIGVEVTPIAVRLNGVSLFRRAVRRMAYRRRASRRRYSFHQ